MDRIALLESGNWFEQNVANDLQRTFKGSVVLHDLTLHSDYLSLVKQRPVTTQIDLVFITYFQIYVIEAKKWGFEIVGDRNDHKWTGKANARSFMSVISPIEQNMVHVRALRNLLRRNGYNVPVFESCICVPNGTHIVSDCKEVMESSQLIFKIKCDQLNFVEGRTKNKKELDVRYWDEAISDVIRKQIRRQRS